MSTRYRADIFTADGIGLPSVVPIAGDCTLVERDIGTLHLVLPASYPISFLQKDGIIRLYRNVGTTFRLAGNATWFIRHRRQSLSGRERVTEVWAEHANTLLARRIVAYTAGSNEASKSDYADDMIKEIVTENFTSPSDAARTVTGITIQADTSQAPTVDRSFSRRNVLNVLRDLCDDAAALGTYLGFELRTLQSGNTYSFLFLTYINHRGVDRRHGTGNYIPVSVTNGAIVSSSLDEDWSEEATFIYSLGQGEEERRTIGTAQNVVAEGAGAYGRIERAYQANSTNNTDILDNMARSELYNRRGKVQYTATGQDVKGFVFGFDYDWGDVLTINDYDQQFDVYVNPVNFSWDRSGERVNPRFTYNNIGLAL